MPRDTQRQRVYDWQSACIYPQVPDEEQNMTLDECRHLIGRICHRYGYKPNHEPNVFDGRGCRSALSHGGGVDLPRWSRKGWIVCHEMAHEIVSYYRQDWTWAAHGPQFARIFIDILVRFDGWTRGDLLASARTAGVKVATYNQCLPVPLRKKPSLARQENAQIGRASCRERV